MGHLEELRGVIQILGEAAAADNSSLELFIWWLWRHLPRVSKQDAHWVMGISWQVSFIYIASMIGLSLIWSWQQKQSYFLIIGGHLMTTHKSKARCWNDWMLPSATCTGWLGQLLWSGSRISHDRSRWRPLSWHLSAVLNRSDSLTLTDILLISLLKKQEQEYIGHGHGCVTGKWKIWFPRLIGNYGVTPIDSCNNAVIP